MSVARRPRRRGEHRKIDNWEDSALKMPEGGWFPLGRVLLESAAWHALSVAGFKILSCAMSIHLSHARQENGRLAISYDTLERYGLDRHSIRPALDELDALGLMKVSQPGRRPYGSDKGLVATYRLTFDGVIGDHPNAGPASNEWKTVRDAAHARELKQLVKKPVRLSKPKRSAVILELVRDAA